MRSAQNLRPQNPALVLLVDDNEDGSLARRSVLEELGYTVVTARCGSDALSCIAQQEFDLLITDFRMAPVNGLELIAELRAGGFRKPIILLTGFAEKVGLTPEATGADIVLQKSANEISQLVRSAKRLLTVPKKPAATQGIAAGRVSAR